MEYLLVKDTETGKTLLVSRRSLAPTYLVVYDTTEPVEVKKRSIGKVIRSWMKDRRNDNSR